MVQEAAVSKARESREHAFDRRAAAAAANEKNENKNIYGHV
jgi:hypothetical protein